MTRCQESDELGRTVCVTGMYYELDHSHGIYVFSKLTSKHLTPCEKSHEKILRRQQQRLLFPSTFYANGEEKCESEANIRKSTRRYFSTMMQGSRKQTPGSTRKRGACLSFFAFRKRKSRRERRRSRSQRGDKGRGRPFTVTPHAERLSVKPLDDGERPLLGRLTPSWVTDSLLQEVGHCQGT